MVIIVVVKVAENTFHIMSRIERSMGAGWWKYLVLMVVAVVVTFQVVKMVMLVAVVVTFKVVKMVVVMIECGSHDSHCGSQSGVWLFWASKCRSPLIYGMVIFVCIEDYVRGVTSLMIGFAGIMRVATQATREIKNATYFWALTHNYRCYGSATLWLNSAVQFFCRRLFFLGSPQEKAFQS
jgi:hypothetical protein